MSFWRTAEQRTRNIDIGNILLRRSLEKESRVIAYLVVRFHRALLYISGEKKEETKEPSWMTTKSAEKESFGEEILLQTGTRICRREEFSFTTFVLRLFSRNVGRCRPRKNQRIIRLYRQRSLSFVVLLKKFLAR